MNMLVIHTVSPSIHFAQLQNCKTCRSAPFFDIMQRQQSLAPSFPWKPCHTPRKASRQGDRKSRPRVKRGREGRSCSWVTQTWQKEAKEDPVRERHDFMLLVEHVMSRETQDVQENQWILLCAYHSHEERWLQGEKQTRRRPGLGGVQPLDVLRVWNTRRQKLRCASIFSFYFRRRAKRA